MTNSLRIEVKDSLRNHKGVRLIRVLSALGIAHSTWYRKRFGNGKRKKPGPAPHPVPKKIEELAVTTAETNPWYGYKKIAVLCRWSEPCVTNRQVYKVMKEHRLLKERKPRKAALYQASKLYELLPGQVNDLWQMDVTYIHIPGYGWWYAVTVIDYYSRYLLAAYFTSSYSAMEVTYALQIARSEAERICGPLKKPPFVVTDNGSSFIAKRFSDFLGDDYKHVRIQYRTPTQLGLLERFHSTLKEEEVYWRLYENPGHARACIAEFRERYNTKRPHWALIPKKGGDPVTPEDVYITGMVTRLPKWQKWAKGAKAKLDKLMKEDAA